MGYKSILVQAGDGSRSAAPCRAAARLARQYGARIIGVDATDYAVITDPSVSFTSPRVLKARFEQTEDVSRAAEAAFRACAEAEGVEAIWRRSFDSPASALTEEARGADLVVAVRTAGDDRRCVAYAGDLIMAAGVPVVVVPPSVEQIEARTVLVAWKDTRETRRAISAAMPLLRRAQRVVVGSIQESRDTDRLLAELNDVAERVRRHGVVVDVDLAPRLTASVADQLIGLMQVQGADFVVAGAYGHTRLREWIFGGVTDRLLHATPVPALLIH